MTNWKLIDNVVDYLTDIYEAEHIMETRKAIQARVLNWYNHTDIADEQMLIAAAWIGDYSPSIKYSDIESARDVLFLEVYTPDFDGMNIHIGEIEEALNDEFWWS